MLKEKQVTYPKIYENFPMERNSAVLRAHKTKFDEKPFFCQIYAILSEKWYIIVSDRYFPSFLKGFEDFSYSLMLSLLSL